MRSPVHSIPCDERQANTISFHFQADVEAVVVAVVVLAAVAVVALLVVAVVVAAVVVVLRVPRVVPRSSLYVSSVAGSDRWVWILIQGYVGASPSRRCLRCPWW